MKFNIGKSNGNKQNIQSGSDDSVIQIQINCELWQVVLAVCIIALFFIY